MPLVPMCRGKASPVVKQYCGRVSLPLYPLSLCYSLFINLNNLKKKVEEVIFNLDMDKEIFKYRKVW